MFEKQPKYIPTAEELRKKTLEEPKKNTEGIGGFEEFAYGLANKLEDLNFKLADYIEILANKTGDAAEKAGEVLNDLMDNQLIHELMMMSSRRGAWKGKEKWLEDSHLTDEDLFSYCKDFERDAGQTMANIKMWSAKLLEEPNNENIKWIIDDSKAYLEGHLSDVRIFKNEIKRRGAQMPIEKLSESEK